MLVQRLHLLNLYVTSADHTQLRQMHLLQIRIYHVQVIIQTCIVFLKVRIITFNLPLVRDNCFHQKPYDFCSSYKLFTCVAKQQYLFLVPQIPKLRDTCI